jgi:hypothetical protein
MIGFWTKNRIQATPQIQLASNDPRQGKTKTLSDKHRNSRAWVSSWFPPWEMKDSLKKTSTASYHPSSECCQWEPESHPLQHNKKYSCHAETVYHHIWTNSLPQLKQNWFMPMPPKNFPERARALRADWAPGPAFLVLFPPVARSLMCSAVMPKSWRDKKQLSANTPWESTTGLHANQIAMLTSWLPKKILMNTPQKAS